MRKLSIFAILAMALAGCTNPETINDAFTGIQYHKVPQCYNVQIAPKTLRRYNNQTGVDDIYTPVSNIYETRCNYNPYYATTLYGNGGSLNHAVYGGGF